MSDLDGSLVEDFRINRRGPVTAVRNAPSPAATASLRSPNTWSIVRLRTDRPVGQRLDATRATAAATSTATAGSKTLGTM